MNNAKMWLVVKPTVGIPMLLTAVVLGSVMIHLAVYTSSGWLGGFMSGAPLNPAPAAEASS
jgi:light-harvesting protein B-800-850 alpha chain